VNLSPAYIESHLLSTLFVFFISLIISFVFISSPQRDSARADKILLKNKALLKELLERFGLELPRELQEDSVEEAHVPKA
tara:strand:- start:178 stop:417 length:240 start_codon:yes stop_codon:yes gene_type:complete